MSASPHHNGGVPTHKYQFHAEKLLETFRERHRDDLLPLYHFNTKTCEYHLKSKAKFLELYIYTWLQDIKSFQKVY